MNKYISYISVLMLGTVGLSSCNDNWETPPMVYPEATMQANVGLDALKTKYWSTDRNSVNTVGTAGDITSNAELAGDSAIFRGRVISESASGNIYNSIVVQGEDCALNISVRTNKLTAIPAFGQEIFVNITGMKIGNYNGLMQLGAEGTYNGAPSMTFMESADFEAKFQINGVPDPSKVDTVLITLPEIASKSQDVLLKYQSQLVRIDGLTFDEPGQPFAGSQNTNRYAKDAQGNSINVRTSAYASFKNDIVPSGQGSVVGILSYFGNDWQLLLNDITGIIGFDETTNPDNPDTPDTPDNPDNPSGDATTVFSSLDASATELPAGWTIDNGTLPTGLEYVWGWKTYQDKGYLNASAFVGGTKYAVEAYAISPEINLAGVKDVSMTFEHAAKFQTTLRTHCGVVVREVGATTWTPLTIPTWPEAGAWTFASSGAISLEAFAGKKIQIAFKYGSTADGADTWEVKNLIVTGKK